MPDYEKKYYTQQEIAEYEATIRQRKLRKITQKLMGLSLIIISCIIPLIDTDVTACVFLLPLGTYALFTNEDIIN